MLYIQLLFLFIFCFINILWTKSRFYYLNHLFSAKFDLNHTWNKNNFNEYKCFYCSFEEKSFFSLTHWRKAKALNRHWAIGSLCPLLVRWKFDFNWSSISNDKIWLFPILLNIRFVRKNSALDCSFPINNPKYKSISLPDIW